MKKVIVLLVLVVSTKGAQVFGQSYSLQAAIDMALENNKEVVNSKLDVAASDYRIKEARSAFLPNAELTGKSLYYKDLPAQYIPASTFGGPEGSYTKVSLNMRQNTSATIQVTQNLYNQNAIIGVKSAKMAKEASIFSENLTRENIVYEVSATYYNIQVLQDNLDRVDDNIVNLEKSVAINEVLKDNELIPENVHSRMLVNLENLRNQRELQKLQVEEHLNYLKFLMNRPMEETIAVVPFDYSEEPDSTYQQTIQERTDLQLQKTQVELARFDKRQLKAGYYPVLSSTYSLGYTGFNDEFAPFEQINNDWVRSSYVSLNVKVPVFDGFKKRNQIRQKEVEIEKNLNLLSAMELKAEKEVSDARLNLASNWNLYENNKRSLELAESLFASAQGDYAGGLSTVTDLLNAQNDLSNARNNYSSALLNLKLAELALMKANGTLLSNFKN